MAVESAGCPYVKIPVPIQDTYSVAEIAILLRVSRNAVYEWSLLEDDSPATEEDDGSEEGPLRVQGRAARVEQTARDVIEVRQNLSGRPASIRVGIVPAKLTRRFIEAPPPIKPRPLLPRYHERKS